MEQHAPCSVYSMHSIHTNNPSESLLVEMNSCINIIQLASLNNLRYILVTATVTCCVYTHHEYGKIRTRVSDTPQLATHPNSRERLMGIATRFICKIDLYVEILIMIYIIIINRSPIFVWLQIALAQLDYVTTTAHAQFLANIVALALAPCLQAPPSCAQH